jgi:hypothetical protein
VSAKPRRKAISEVRRSALGQVVPGEVFAGVGEDRLLGGAFLAVALAESRAEVVVHRPAVGG